MTIIYLIRHGEVENPEQIWYGRLPGYGLSQKGKAEIKQTAHFLSDRNIHALYSSSLKRAHESAAIIQEALRLPTITFDDDLLEVRSAFQRIKLEDAWKMRFDWYFSSDRKPLDETMAEIRDRMQKFLNTIYTHYPEKQIAAISHGDPIMIIKASLEGRPLNLDAIREGHYLSHGEVLKVIIQNKKMLIKSVFTPKERVSP